MSKKNNQKPAAPKSEEVEGTIETTAQVAAGQEQEGAAVEQAADTLESESAETRLAALERLEGNLSPDAYNRIKALTGRGDDGSYAEPDDRTRRAAAVTISSHAITLFMIILRASIDIPHSK